MKKLLPFPIMILTILFASASCVTIKVAEHRINAGPQHSRFFGDSDSYKHAYGFQAGLSTGIMDMINRSICLRAEANISLQGAGYEDDFGNGPMEGITRLLYLNVPVLAEYRFENGFFAEAGLQPGFLLSAKDKFEGETYDYKDWVNFFDFGIPFGFGYQFKNNFGIGLRIIPGLTNINAGEETVSKDRNLVIAIRGSYTFGKKQ
jgi:outer membrane immunogenic protein